MARIKKVTFMAEQAIAALMQTGSVTRAAEALNIHPATLRSFMEDPAFKAQFTEARRRTVDEAIARAGAVLLDTVNELAGLIKDKDAAGNARVSAARLIWDMALHGVDLDELVNRLDALEKSRGATDAA